MKWNRILFAAVATFLFAPGVLLGSSTPLTITCPTNLQVAATGSGGAIVFYTVTASGGCSPPPSVTATPPSGSTFPIGTTTVTAVASDACHNTNNCSFTITVRQTPIVLTCPSNITVAATSASGTTVFFSAFASGGCSPPPSVVANPPSGSTFPVGTTLVSVTASDTCGNSTNGSFTVTVVGTPLVLNCPSNLTVAASSPSGATVFFSATATGGCSPPPNVMASPPSGSTFAVGTTTVSTTASDSCGNSTNCSFTVTVTPPTNNLVVNCPSNVTVTATGPAGATVFFTATASGGCSPPPYVTANPPSGSTFPIGTNTVMVTASDACANSANCNFIVTVKPSGQPLQTNSFPFASLQLQLEFPDFHTETITFKGQLTMASAIGPAGQASDTDVSGLDEVGTEMIALTLTGNSSNGPVTMTLNPNQTTLGQIQENFNSTPGILDMPPFTPGGTAASFFDIFTEISLRGGPALFPATPPHLAGTITNFPSGPGNALSSYNFIPLLDGNSNSTGYYITGMQLIPSGVTNSPLVLNCPSNLTVAATSLSGATVYFSATASGGCSPPPNVMANPPSGSTFAIGATPVFTTASDSCGNSTNCSFTITVNPPTNSVVINCPSNITVTATGPAGATVFFTATASGGCNPPPYVSANPPSGSTFPVGTNTVMVTASDTCANSASCNFTVTVKPSTQPLQTNSFPSALVQLQIEYPDFHTETITLKGQFTMASAIGPAGQASDTDGSGLDEVGTEMITLNLTGNSSNGPVTMTLNPSQMTLGQIQEDFNSTPGVLDVPPFKPSGTASSFFDIFTEISLDGGPAMFPATPPYVSGIITNFPSGPGNSLSSYEFIPLLDSVGNYTGYYLAGMQLTPSPVTNSPIILNCASNLIVTALGPYGATAFFTVTATGGCSMPTVMANPPSGSTFAVGTNTVTVTASDTCGNSTNCSFTITVNPPTNHLVLDCPTNITVTAAGPLGAVVFFSLNATGGCNPPPYVTAYPPSGSTFPVGTTMVTTTASDSCGNNTNCSFTVTVVPSTGPPADLQVAKTASPTNATAGQQVIFTIALKNLGPNNVTNDIIVTDCLPPGFEYVTDSTYGGGGIGIYSPGTCRWTLTGLGVNATVYLNITAVTTSTGSFTNTATVAVPQGYTDPNLANNSASAVVKVTQPGADLQVTKMVSTNAAKLFQQFTFLVTITNVGPTAVSNVFVNDLLPAGLTEVYWVGYGGINQDYNPTNGVWSITNIPPGLGYSLSIGTAGALAGTFTNLAQLTASTPADTNAANNAASAGITILPLQADLAVTKTVSPGVMNTNGQVQFTVTIQNNGPDTATNIVVQDTLPAGLSLVSSNVPSGTVFNAATGAWSIPFLTNGATAALGLRVTTPNAGSFTNVASVASSGSTDPNLLNNTNRAVAIFIAGQAADLAVSLVPTTNAVPVGGTILFTCTVTNLGPNSPTNVTAKLTYPPGIVISGVFGPFGSGAFDTNTGILTVFGALLPGTTEGVNVQFTVTNAGVFTLSFQTASSSLPDPILSNNSASVTVTGLVSYAISGGIRSCSGAAVTNVPVVLSAANMSNQSTNTGTNGSFVFRSLLPGSYTVTPASSNYFYVPTNMVVTIVNTNVTLTNFIALPAFITGTVLQGGTNGQPVAGVTVLLGGALSLTNTTGTNGVYIFTNLIAASYTVTPLTNGFPGIRFAPTNATVALGSPTNCPGAANFVTTNIIVVLRALEVIQVVQDWSNSVVLIANKATLVRAHLQLYGTNTTPILVEGARLYAQNLGGGSANWAPDNGRITVRTNNCAAPLIRSNINLSLNFTVRDGFKTGSDIFRFSWTNGIVFNAEPADVSGDPGSNGQVRVSFNAVPPLGVRFIRVAITNAVTNITALATNITIVTNLPTAAQIEEEKRRIISIYPIVSLANLANGYYFWSRANGAPNNESKLLSGLNAARLTSSDTNGVATNRIWYGVLPQGVSVRGLGYLPGYAAEGCISRSPQDYQRHLAAHEIGHTMGRPHSIDASFGKGDCNAGQVSGHCEECATAGTANFPMVDTPAFGLMPTLGPLADDNQVIWGYDHYQELVISPYYYYDLMSYCYGATKGFGANDLGPWPWNSKFTYTNLYAVNQTRFAAVAPHSLPQGLPTPANGPSSPAQSSEPYLLVRGQMDDYSGAVTFQPCYPASSPLPVTSGPFTLVVLNSNAVPLYALPFAPDVVEGEFDDQPGITTFDLSVPIISGAAAIEIYSNAIPVGELVSDAYPPSVQVLHPNGGEKFGDADIPVSWTASDPDGSPLVYLVQFSPDGGNSWDTLMIDWDQTNLDIPPDTLAATTNGLIRVIASDGFNTGAAVSAGPFTITNHVPAISILQPGSGALFYGDQTIVLEADAYDLEDGSLDGTNVLWTSSLDGPLGSGDTLPLETLNLHEGIHLMTATAVANSGLTNSASVQIIVLRLAPPQLSIQLANNSQILVSWPVVYTNYLLESTTSLLPSNWATVTNKPVGADLLQTVNLNLSTTNRFFRLRLP